MKIQLIGLPGAGKTSAIKLYNQQYDHDHILLDLANYSGINRERFFLTDIHYSILDTLAESACGVLYSKTINIKLEPSIKVILKNLEHRGDEIDIEYLAGLNRQTIPTHYTIKEREEIPPLLAKLFNVNR
jgi:GTPase SAR1 family protein